MDRVFIRALELETVIGVWAWERSVPQPVVLDLELAVDVRAAAASDAIDDTVSYHSVAERVKALVEASQFRLVETLAERIAELLLAEFPVPWLALTVTKPAAVRGAREVGVRIERGARGGDG